MQIYFVRHGKTEWNLERRFQGAHGDSPLLAESLNDIEKLGNHLKGTNFNGIYSSPLKRAFDTANGVKKAISSDLSVKKDERLREFDMGLMEGLKFDKASAKFPKQVDDIWNRPDKYDGKSIQGENYPDVISRGKSFATEKASQFTGVDDKVLAVSHGAALGAIMGGLLGYPLKDVRCNGPLSNTSLTILETLDQGATFKLIVWNDTSFLERDISETDAL